jgi:hypothetical protein
VSIDLDIRVSKDVNEAFQRVVIIDPAGVLRARFKVPSRLWPLLPDTVEFINKVFGVFQDG